MTQSRNADYKQAIAASGHSIYAPIDPSDACLWIPTDQLEVMLNDGLKGQSLAGLALRTRSKVVKVLVCQALGYPIPTSFKKTQPRFVGQQLDTYVQKSLNLQIWNEDVALSRRYAIIQVDQDDVIGWVRVVHGQELALFDSTGVITRKYQAHLTVGVIAHELISVQDTEPMLTHVRAGVTFDVEVSPVYLPETQYLLPVKEIFQRLSPLVSQTFADPGKDQERNRGAALHRLVCAQLGYSRYEDAGQFPDVPHQLLEVKLQTSSTIDLGLVQPNSEEYFVMKPAASLCPRHCDTRYAVFYGVTDGTTVTLTHLIVATGADFFSRFRRFEGAVTNGKIQLHLPRDFFGL